MASKTGMPASLLLYENPECGKTTFGIFLTLAWLRFP